MRFPDLRNEGSSPRMRGARFCLRKMVWCTRIIPADAGSTDRRRPGTSADRDHPRGCGEHPSSHHARPFAAGSSPRMRGALPARADGSAEMGIIPADAGSTIRPSPVSKPTWDHPRGCGEHASLTSWSPSPHGSSPRMRGAQTGLSSDEQALGIIPADAGSTTARKGPAPHAGDHPRGCGEH